MQIEVEGLRGLEASINRLVEDVNQAGNKGLQAVGMEIVAEAKANLKRNRTTNTGVLSSSGKVQKQSDGTVDAGFFSTDSQQGYAAAVEYGRGPSRRRGAIPLRETLKAWVHRKLGIAYGKELDGAAFLIARKIHRKGTKPQPFFTPAVEKVQQKLEDIMSKHIDEATK